jgi:hypothetical protein
MRVVDEFTDPTAWSIAAALTWSRGWDALVGVMRRMALAETLAHLHHLAVTGLVRELAGTPRRWTRR